MADDGFNVFHQPDRVLKRNGIDLLKYIRNRFAVFRIGKTIGGIDVSGLEFFDTGIGAVILKVVENMF